MMLDFILDDERDLAITDGDLVTGFADQQHQEDLLLLDKAGSKEFLTTGVGAFRFLEYEDKAQLLQEIAMQFSADGMKVNSVQVAADGKINIDAVYL